MVCAYFSSNLTTTSWILLSYEVAKKVVPSWKWKEQQGRRSSKSRVVTTDCRLDPGSPEYADNSWISSNDKKPPESMTDNTLSFRFLYNLHSLIVPKLRFHLHNNNNKMSLQIQGWELTSIHMCQFPVTSKSKSDTMPDGKSLKLFSM